MLSAVELELSGVYLMTPDLIKDDRGFFSEIYNKRDLASVGIEEEFVQDNHSYSAESGTVRGLHFQIEPHPIAKLVRVTRGSILDVVVDIRRGSPTFGRHVAVELSADNWRQVYAPIGTAHGFRTLEPDTEVTYKVTDHWYEHVDKGLAWNDPDLEIDWGIAESAAVLSDKDRSQPILVELPAYFDWNES